MLSTLSDQFSRDTPRTKIPCHLCGKYVREAGLKRVVIADDSDARTCVDICPLCLADPRNIQGYVPEHVVEAIETHGTDAV